MGKAKGTIKIISQGKIDVIEKDFMENSEKSKPMTQQEICKICETKDCKNCNSRQDKDESEKENFKIPVLPEAPEIPAEFINYRMTLKEQLRRKDSLEYNIANLKAQLKAVEKSIEDMNKQFANEEYTGDLFKQKKPEENKPISKPSKREDGPEYDEFIALVAEEKRFIEDVLDTSDYNPEYNALIEFVLTNPESTTAYVMYSKVTFEKATEDDEDYSLFTMPKIDDRSDFITTFVCEPDRNKFKEIMERQGELKFESKQKEQDKDERPKRGQKINLI